MHSCARLTRAFVCAALLGGCAKTPPPPLLDVAVATETRVAPDAITESSVVETAASIVALDERARVVTLRLPDGRLETVRVDPAVGSLRTVRLGDEVVVTYYEQLAIDVKKPGSGEPGVARDAEVATAAPGTRPGGVAAETTTVSAAVVAVDRKHHRLTLRGPDGKVTTVGVHDPARLATVRVGDLVALSVTEALAVQIEKAPKR